VLALFFHKAAGDPGTQAAGLLSAVMGLVLFLDGLRLSIMPMAMQVGATLLCKLHSSCERVLCVGHSSSAASSQPTLSRS